MLAAWLSPLYLWLIYRKPVYAPRGDQVDEATARTAAQARLGALNRGPDAPSLTLKPGVLDPKSAKELTAAMFVGVDKKLPADKRRFTKGLEKVRS